MRKKENLECTKPGTYHFITNFLEESIKNKKKFYIPVIKCSLSHTPSCLGDCLRGEKQKGGDM